MHSLVLRLKQHRWIYVDWGIFTPALAISHTSPDAKEGRLRLFFSFLSFFFFLGQK